MTKRLAVIGSSGGNLYNQGGKDPGKLLGEIFVQARQAGMEIAAIQFIGAGATMDTINESAFARLYVLGDDRTVAVAAEGSLDDVNTRAMEKDEEIAARIRDGEIDGIIVMSSDPDRVNAKTVAAAAEKNIPIVGTGGTSIAKCQSMRARVISASGTTGTTNRTRAIGFITAFAKEWGIRYRPAIGGSSHADAALTDENVWKRVNLRGIMLGALPGFIAMAIILALSKLDLLAPLQRVFDVPI
ncbi:MAG: PTS sugar transporter, partial [Planctomycetes bacterium]|nr:PTS sugar transporter [Planctomycetota bacterium]